MSLCAALLFGNDTNPAHPKHIGSIDPTCSVAEVVSGELKENQSLWKYFIIVLSFFLVFVANICSFMGKLVI